MGMTIDETLETIKGERWISCQEKYLEAMNLITETMRKYQQIEKILKKTHEGCITKFQKIKEVVENGNDTANTGSN